MVQDSACLRARNVVDVLLVVFSFLLFIIRCLSMAAYGYRTALNPSNKKRATAWIAVSKIIKINRTEFSVMFLLLKP